MRAQCIHLQFGDALLHFRAAKLERRHDRIHVRALLFLGQHAQHRPLECGQIHLHAARTCVRTRAFRCSGTATDARMPRRLARLVELALVPVEIGARGAFLVEQILGVRPALTGLARPDFPGAHARYRGTPRSIPMPPSMDWIGRTVMPGVFMSTSRKEMPRCGLTFGSVRTRKKPQRE